MERVGSRLKTSGEVERSFLTGGDTRGRYEIVRLIKYGVSKEHGDETRSVTRTPNSCSSGIPGTEAQRVSQTVGHDLILEALPSP